MFHISQGPARALTRLSVRSSRWALALTTAGLWLVHGVAAAQQTAGEVIKLDSAQQKVTLKHGPITSLDMPAMTMVFRVKDPALLQGLNAGDKVKFDAEKVNGQLIVTRLSH